MSAITDLDLAILGTLPREGEKLGPHTLAKQAKQIVAELNADLPPDAPKGAHTTGAQINGRVRSLKFEGLVVDRVVTPVSDGLGWQITPMGERTLAREGR